MKNVLAIVTRKTNVVLRFKIFKGVRREHGGRLVAMSATSKGLVSAVSAAQTEQVHLALRWPVKIVSRYRVSSNKDE